MFAYLSPNGTACASLPSTAGGGGALSDWQVGAVGAGSCNQTLYFLAPVLSLDAVRRHTQSQAVLLAVFDTQHWAVMERRSRGRGHGHGGRRAGGEADAGRGCQLFKKKLKTRICGAWFRGAPQKSESFLWRTSGVRHRKKLVAEIMWRTGRAPQNSKSVRH